MRRDSLSVRDEYYALDPSEPADPFVLNDLYERLNRTQTGQRSEEAAAIAIELAQHPRVSQDDRAEYAEEATQRFEARNGIGRRILRGYRPDMLRAHLPLFAGNDPEVGRESVIRNSAVTMKSWRDRYLASNRIHTGRNTGFAYELGTCLAANATQPSLLAYPSLPRQDANTRLVDGKIYKWDVSVESDGSVIQEGLYRVQVKSSWNRAGYHPDINVMVLGDLLPYKTDIFILPELLQHPDGKFSGLLDKLSNYIVRRLGEKPPASQQMAYIR